MNESILSGRLARWIYSVVIAARRVGAKRQCEAFAAPSETRADAIQEIYVINLDRQIGRWGRMERELGSVRGATGAPLSSITKRFAAVDARRYQGSPADDTLVPEYSLGDQLFVEPQPMLSERTVGDDRRIVMTPQEIAVALSHISLWRLIASGDQPYSLVLEDDVYFKRDFAPMLSRAWPGLPQANGGPAFDLLYLSYQEAKGGAERTTAGHGSELLFKPRRGLWHLSGYVLSKVGAQKLVDFLPVRGPVDLWVNHQFDIIRVFATHESIISQRRDLGSSNSYSVLPVLYRLGIMSRKEPLLFEAPNLLAPVFAVGAPGTGTTSLAMAMSMLGYRCLGDVDSLPEQEERSLFGKKARIFDSYVNVSSLSDRYVELAALYPEAKFIVTVSGEKCSITSDTLEIAPKLRETSADLLILPGGESDRWELLCSFLECEQPVGPFPNCPDQPSRCRVDQRPATGWHQSRRVTKLEWDASPWIVDSATRWTGIHLDTPIGRENMSRGRKARLLAEDKQLDDSSWKILEETFTSNIALFTKDNLNVRTDGTVGLTLRKERVGVREYTSAAICSRERYMYGRFSAIMRAAPVPGLVTGIFLQRNAPRQEIDIEVLGKDPTKMLVNVYYNPGSEGARMEYGYRGTPVLVDLGFDVSKDFHEYVINWSSTSITWRVDGDVIYERGLWNPTPIPHLPMNFHVNLWSSRSQQLAGELSDRDLPADVHIRALEVHGGFEADSALQALTA